MLSYEVDIADFVMFCLWLNHTHMTRLAAVLPNYLLFVFFDVPDSLVCICSCGLMVF